MYPSPSSELPTYTICTAICRSASTEQPSRSPCLGTALLLLGADGARSLSRKPKQANQSLCVPDFPRKSESYSLRRRDSHQLHVLANVDPTADRDAVGRRDASIKDVGYLGKATGASVERAHLGHLSKPVSGLFCGLTSNGGIGRLAAVDLPRHRLKQPRIAMRYAGVPKLPS